MTTLAAQLNVPQVPMSQSIGLITSRLDTERKVISPIKSMPNTTNVASLINSTMPQIQNPVINFTFTSADLRQNTTALTTQTVNSFSNITVTRDVKQDQSTPLAAFQKPIIVTVSGLSGVSQGNRQQVPVISGIDSSVLTASMQAMTFPEKFIPITSVVQSGDQKAVFPQTFVSVPSTNVSVLPKSNISTPTLIPPPPPLTSVIPPTSFSSLPVTYSTFTPTVSTADISPVAFTVPVTPVHVSQSCSTISMLPVINTSTFHSNDKQVSMGPPDLSPTNVTLPSCDTSSLESTVSSDKKNNHTDPTSADFDPIKAMDWIDGVASLPGSDLKFKLSEFGTLEVITDDTKMVNGDVPKTEMYDIEILSAAKCANEQEKQDVPKSNNIANVSEEKEMIQKVAQMDDKICCCKNCSCHGLLSEFDLSGKFCSETCSSEYNKKNESQKKEKNSSTMIPRKPRKQSYFNNSNNNINNNNNNNNNNSIEETIEGQKDTKMIKTESFSWISYVEQQKAVRAPMKLFRDYQSFPTTKNNFKVGMKLEGIDPRHPSLFCVLTVAEILGFRIRLHFDGYSDCYDFWVNADSPDIFPVGWCEKTNHQLQPPKGYEAGEFNWNTYLKLKSQAAPKHLFSVNNSQPISHGFKLGMKLEAIDKKNTSLICVATVADVLDNRFLVHFDGWDDDYDYWTDPTSPYIHPVNWCSEYGHILTPPNNYKKTESFSWKDYLSETRSQAVPASAFKSHPTHGFKPGMKLEVVDRRNTMLIRVATVADIQPHFLKIHFDGWSDAYDYWVDDDSSDIHPVNWCLKIGHPLQPPITSTNIIPQGQGGCPTPGCKGIGHIKGPKYTSHHSAFGCPYSQLNINKDTALQDRLDPPRNENNIDFSRRYTETSGAMESLRRCPTPGCDGSGHTAGKYSVHHKISECPLAQMDHVNGEDSRDSDSSKLPLKIHSGRGRKRKLIEEKRKLDQNVSQSTKPLPSLEDKIHKSVFLAPPIIDPQFEQSLHWEQHTKFLPSVNLISEEIVSKWSVAEVANYIANLSGCEEYSQLFKEEQIDGEAFLLLNQMDIVKILNIKLGPALKIHNSILSFKRNIIE